MNTCNKHGVDSDLGAFVSIELNRPATPINYLTIDFMPLLIFSNTAVVRIKSALTCRGEFDDIRDSVSQRAHFPNAYQLSGLVRNAGYISFTFVDAVCAYAQKTENNGKVFFHGSPYKNTL
jgi:hypothetical protein